MDFFRFLMNDVLSEPAILVGLIALIGLIAQKKPVTECIKGTSKKRSVDEAESFGLHLAQKH